MNFYAGNALVERIHAAVKISHAPIQRGYQPRERNTHCDNCPEFLAHIESIATLWLINKF